jgi:hypothetical protein
MADDVSPLYPDGNGRDPLRIAGEALCAKFVERLPISGASISVVGGYGQLTIGASDRVAARLEELQFELGEGPHHEALESGRPALIPTLDSDQKARWPFFGAAAENIGARAVFAFPMAVGAATVGVVDTYRATPGGLDGEAIAAALTLASRTAGPALRLAAQSANIATPSGRGISPELRREVHQATGIILVQLGVTATDALSRLQAHAFASGQTVEYVAREVVARRIDFRDLAES